MSTITPAHEAIALLIDLAQRGEINPWDVQVIDVIDRYLWELGINREQEEQQHTHLPQSGQAFLWASMLVLLKADTLQRQEEAESVEADIFEEQDWESHYDQRTLPLRLEKHIRRRPTAPPQRKRRVTLQELITQLEDIAAVLEGKDNLTTRAKPRSPSRSEAKRIITQLAHNENLTEIASQLEEFLNFNWSDLAPESNSIDLEKLLDWWSNAQENYPDLSHQTSQTPSKDKVGVFWALLLLSAQSKVELLQEEFYQDLTIKPLQRGNIPELAR